MDEIIYEALQKYYKTLELKGYLPDIQAYKLIVLAFYNDFVYSDYRGLLSEADYHLIETALDCIFGSTCLIPYPDYMKMGKLYLGQITEMAQRVKTLEDTNVIKPVHDTSDIDLIADSDVMIVSDDNDK